MQRCTWLLICCGILVVKAKLSYETKLPANMLNSETQFAASESQHHDNPAWNGPSSAQATPYSSGAINDRVNAEMVNDDTTANDDGEYDDGDGDDGDDHDESNSPRRGGDEGDDDGEF